MQKVINGLKVLLAVISGASLITGVAFLTACNNGTQDSTSGSNSSSAEESDTEEEQADIVSGEYIVDVSWTGGMQNYMTLVVNIDADAMTFNQYYTSDSATSKGSGSLTYSGGIYTMNYADTEVDSVTTTTFTFDSESTVITFTSALLWGTRSFDSSTTAEDGSFVTYTAQPIVASGEYNVDLEWTGGMAAYVTAIVNIDMSTMSFNLYYQSSPDTSKGTGTVVYAAGVYTMNYTDLEIDGVSTTTFTYDGATNIITFTSPLLWGSSSFDSSTTTDDGSFLPYTAEYVTDSE